MDALRQKYPLWRYLLAGSLCLCLFASVNILCQTLSPPDPRETGLLKMGLSALQQPNIEAVNIGGSTGKALLFPETGIRGVNLAFDGRDIFENAILLDLALQQNSALTTVFLSAGPLGMLYDNADLAYLARRQFYRVIAPYAGFSPVHGRDWHNLLMSHLLPKITLNQWRTAFKKSGDASVLKQEKSHRFYNSPAPALEMPLADHHKRLNDFENRDIMLFNQIEKYTYFNPDISNQAATTLANMCRSVQAYGANLIIYTTPTTRMYFELSRHLQKIALPYWNKAIQECQNMGARFISFDNDKNFHQAYDLFDDPLHLNINGARKFSKILAGKINN